MSKETVKSIVDWLKSQEPDVSTKKWGYILYRGFNPKERYVIDFAPDFRGWTQYDTDQDAAYFGVWIHQTELLVLTYAEGDWTLVECETNENFIAKVQSMNEFYGEGFECKVIDNETGEMTIYRQDRTKFATAAKIELNDNFWDCECKKGYIKSITKVNCSKCGAFCDDQPSSRQEEVEEMMRESRVAIHSTDKFGRKWFLSLSQLCLLCGQPDDYADCNHTKLTEKEVLTLGGKF